jgi:hypothetical protein
MDEAEAARALAEDQAKPMALAWIDSALASLDRFEASGDDLALAALEANFAWARTTRDDRIARVRLVAATFTTARTILHQSRTRFRGASEAEARRFFPAPAPIPPGYAVYGRHVFFTPSFADFGPKCRAAMVLHESIHVFDLRSGEPDVHVSEWDEPRFSGLSPEQAIHNPSSYASFAAQVHHERLAWPQCERFGAGRPGD